MLGFLVLLAIVKLYLDQRREDKIAKQIEEFEDHYCPPKDHLT